MSYMTALERTRPGKQPLTRDVPSRRMGRRMGRFHRHPYMLDGEIPDRIATSFSPLYGDFGYGAGGMGEISLHEGVQAVESLFRSIATATGLRDPIAHYEPGKSLNEVWAKYDADVDRYLTKEIPSLRSATAQKALTDEMMKCKVIRDRLKAAFTPGAVIGERDRERLAELVVCVRNFRKNWNDAHAKYGSAPVIPTAAPTVAAPKQESGFNPLFLLPLLFLLK